MPQTSGRCTILYSVCLCRRLFVSGRQKCQGGEWEKLNQNEIIPSKKKRSTPATSKIRTTLAKECAQMNWDMRKQETLVYRWATHVTRVCFRHEPPLGFFFSSSKKSVRVNMLLAYGVTYGVTLCVIYGII